jgi:hypothetical protein
MGGPGMGSQGMGGYGMGGGGNDYGSYLRELINANQANPQFQQQMLGQYLDYTNPANQQQLGYTQNQMELEQNELLSSVALSLMSSEDPGAQQRGMAILDSIFGGQVPGYEESYSVQPQTQTYEDLKRQQAQTILSEPEGLKRKDFDWYSFLQNATDEQIRQYEEAKRRFGRDATWNVKGALDTDYWGGTGFYNPFDASAWSAERAARAKLGYF